MNLPEWRALISDQYAELHALVTDAGARYFETTATITATGADSYPLPADVLTTIGVDRIINAATGQRVSLRPIAVQERQVLRGITGSDAFAFEVERERLSLFPRPSSGVYEHLYVPQPQNLEEFANDDTLDVISIYGLNYIVWGVASVALAKGENNQLRALDERGRAERELVYWANNRRAQYDQARRQMNDDTYYDTACDPADWRYR